MLLGLYQHDLERGRYLTIPAPFRAAFAEGMYITQGFEKNLLIITEEAFQLLYRRVMSMSLTDPLARLLLRLILGTASEVEMDESDRIEIPPSLAAFAGLEERVVLVGQGDYLEVWPPEAWEKQLNDLQNAEANASRFAVLDVAIH